MAKARRSNDWGFPRWRGYGSSREATTVRLCDRHGCEEPGDCPAPKSPNSPERWYFCQKHAAEYNSKWDYFEGLEKAEAGQVFGRLLKPEEGARAIGFMCSPASGLMTGAIVDFDQTVLGGWETQPQPVAPLEVP